LLKPVFYTHEFTSVFNEKNAAIHLNKMLTLIYKKIV